MVWYIVTDLVEFEDIPLSIGYQAQISAIDGLGWLKTLDYKSAVGPYNGHRFISHETVLRMVNRYKTKKNS